MELYWKGKMQSSEESLVMRHIFYQESHVDPP
jgi:hypothetical protein